MNLIFKCGAQQWSLLDDKIVFGNQELFLNEIAKIGEISTPKFSFQFGTIQLFTAGGHSYTLSYPHSQRSKFSVALAYICDHANDEEAKKTREIEKKAEEIEQTEFRLRCNVCGKTSCFTIKDLQENENSLKSASISYGFSALNAILGTRYDAYEQNKQGDQARAKIRDYTRCPFCHSTHVEILTDEEWDNIDNKAYVSPQISSADEILKFKKLLDEGIITQEEFDLKKKQLLGI